MQNQEDRRDALIGAFKSKNGKYDPVHSVKKNFKSLVQVSLEDLVAAGTMAIDSRLPQPLIEFAKEIIRTQNGVPFRPRLRKLVRSWLDNEDSAKEWFDYFTMNKEEVDPYLYKLLYPLLKTVLVEQGSIPLKAD